MRKYIALLAILVAGLLCVPVASAGTGIGTGQTALGTITINANNPNASSFAVSTHPSTLNVADGGQISQSLYLSTLCSAYITYYVPNYPYVNCDGSHPASPNPPADWYTKLDFYTMPCIYVNYDANASAAANSPVGIPAFTDNPGWQCGYLDSGPVTDTNVTDVALNNVAGTLGVWPLQNCENMLGLVQPLCASSSPLQTLPAPNLDLLVGSVAIFDVFSNWCSFVAPPGFTLASFVSGQELGGLGCASNQDNVTLSATATTNSSVRFLTSSDPLKTKVRIAVKASPYDCHIPNVKGLTLARAEHKLRLHNCRAAIKRVKGKPGIVLRQPKSRGVAPRGHRVRIVVGKR